MKKLYGTSLVALQMLLAIPALATQEDQKNTIKSTSLNKDSTVELKELSKTLTPVLIEDIDDINEEYDLGPLNTLHIKNILRFLFTTIKLKTDKNYSGLDKNLDATKKTFLQFKDFSFLEILYDDLVAQLGRKEYSWFKAVTQLHTNSIRAFKFSPITSYKSYAWYESEILSLLCDLIVRHKGYPDKETNISEQEKRKRAEKTHKQEVEYYNHFLINSMEMLREQATRPMSLKSIRSIQKYSW